MGYAERTDVGIRVEGWPVQFLPVASALDEAALAEAIELDIGGEPPLTIRVLSPEHTRRQGATAGFAGARLSCSAPSPRAAVSAIRLRPVSQVPTRPPEHRAPRRTVRTTLLAFVHRVRRVSHCRR